MNKKLTTFAIILIIVGTIGTVSTGIASIPYFVNTASNIEKELNKETVIFNEEISINKLNIDINEGNIVIKKHDNNSIKIVQKGKEENNYYEIKNNENELLLTQNNKNNIPEIKTLNDFMNVVIEEVYSYNINSIIVYLPNDTDINVSTNTGSLAIEDDIFLNDLKFNTLDGYISLPSKVKKLKNLDIVSNSYIQLSMSELLGINNVKIKANSVNIYSNENEIFIDNMQEYIPNSLDIYQKNSGYGSITLNVDIPVAKNLNIDAKGSNTELNLPIEKYKMNLNLKALQYISINNLIEKNIISENEIYKYENVRELKGNINTNLDNEEIEYNVNVKSNEIYM